MVEVVAGRRYRVVHITSGTTEEGIAALVVGSTRGTLDVAGWRISPGGDVMGVSAYRVEAVKPDEPAAHVPETTEERHAADLNDLGGNLPRLDARRLELRRLHAMERIADALEGLSCATMDMAWGAADIGDEPDEPLPGEEPVQ